MQTRATRGTSPDTASAPPLRLELAELETFIAVAESGSFSLAAQRLHISQPSVSSRIQRLEASVRTRLLIRTTRSVQVTPEGRLLLDESRRVLTGLRGLVERLRQPPGEATRRITLAASPLVAAMLLPPIIHDYTRKHTDVSIQIRDLRYVDALELLMSGQADLAVLAFEGVDKRVRFQPVRRESMVLMVPRDHALAGRRQASLRAIAPYPLMMLEQYQPMRERIESEVRRLGLRLKPAMTATNLNTLLGMLDARMGITLLPRSMARPGQASGHVVVELKGIELSRTFGIVTLRNASLGSAAQGFSRHLRQALALPAAS